MVDETTFDIATGGNGEVPFDWMPASGARAFVFDDPILVWLDFYGESRGFQKDTSPYEFTDFIFEKSRQFERKWVSEIATGAIRVCKGAWEVRDASKLRQTLELMERGAPLIAGAALWWGPERVFGVPDLLVHGAWLRERFPELHPASHTLEQYWVFDMKFTTKLDSSEKRLGLANSAAQVRIYSYIVGQLTRTMAPQAFLVCRDRVTSPLAVAIRSAAGSPLDEDLRVIRQRFLDIKFNGGNYQPGIHPEIHANLTNDRDGPWHSAKMEIARNRVPGGDPCLVYEIGRTQKVALAGHGFSSVEDLLRPEPEALPLESCSGLGAAKCPRIRAVLRANRTGTVTRGPTPRVPPVKPFEFYVDFETFNNLNVDFEREWPTLEGCEMIFMIGLAWEEGEEWRFRAFVAESESQTSERRMLEEFEEFLRARAGDRLHVASSTALFHYTSAEVWQLRRAADRHGLGADHALRKLPWYDLQREVVLAEPVGVPGAWSFGLKDVVGALGLVKWLGNLDDGLGASVAGWKAYRMGRPLESAEMQVVMEYNEVDCRALRELVRWLRRS